MRIGVVGSMQYTEKMMEICEDFRKYGHDPFVSKFAAAFVGKVDDEKEKIKPELRILAVRG